MSQTKADKIIDARSMEPPEPFVRTMEALDEIAVGEKLLLLLARALDGTDLGLHHLDLGLQQFDLLLFCLGVHVGRGNAFDLFDQGLQLLLQLGNIASAGGRTAG